jgi:hypothetical protein
LAGLKVRSRKSKRNGRDEAAQDAAREVRNRNHEPDV